MSATVLTERGGATDERRMRDGFRAMTPVLAAYAPFALVVGTAVATSADPWSAWAAAAVMLTDAPWALARDRARDDPTYYLGAALALFLAWPAMVTAGALVGTRIDAGPVADLLLPLTLGAVVVPQLRRRPAAAAIAAAVVTAAVTSDADVGTALLLAAATGTAAGLAAGATR